MAKVDIVVPCYNYGRFLEACVRSVLSQSVSDVRVLIIDDSSSDDSVSVAEKLVREDARVSLVAHRANKGHVETFNEGIGWASADYFLLLSADDLLVPGALQRATEVMDENADVVLTYGECIAWFDMLPQPVVARAESNSWTRHDLLRAMCTLAMNPVPAATAVARTRVQKAVGGYRKYLPHAGDMEMWLRFAANGSIARIESVQAIYRKHSAAMSNAYYLEMMSDFRQRQLAFDSFFDEYEDRLGGSRLLRQTSRRALANRIFHHGISMLRRMKLKEGVQLIHFAMDMDRRLRYLPPLWHLLKIPGPAGRDWVKSTVGDAAARLLRLGG